MVIIFYVSFRLIKHNSAPNISFMKRWMGYFLSFELCFQCYKYACRIKTLSCIDLCGESLKPTYLNISYSPAHDLASQHQSILATQSNLFLQATQTIQMTQESTVHFLQFTCALNYWEAAEFSIPSAIKGVKIFEKTRVNKLYYDLRRIKISLCQGSIACVWIYTSSNADIKFMFVSFADIYMWNFLKFVKRSNVQFALVCVFELFF